ncbi:MAG: hypothetical protein WCE75_12065 [Terracidiphilus sp.]
MSEDESEERLKRLGLERLEECERLGEEAYDQMYESCGNPTGCYADAKDFFSEAIGLATRLGLTDRAQSLSERLEHIKAVFRGQFAGVGGYAPLTEPEPEPEPEPLSVEPASEEMLGHFGSNAELVASVCTGMCGFAFAYDARSVEWLDGYIERLRATELTEDDRGQLVSNLGSWLGEAIVAACGGFWARDVYGWHIRFDEQNAAYPFNKVEKQFVYGAEDSILGFYRALLALRGVS